MTLVGFRNLLQSLAKAWGERRYEDAVSCFASDVRYVDPLRYALYGRDQLLAFYRDDGGHPQITVWRHSLFDEASQIGVAEYSYQGTHLYHGAVFIRIEQELISHWREYQHITALDWDSFFKGASF